jgi:DNA repair protein RecO (recombination protein O)
MRIIEFGESDLLVSFFTEDKGRLKGVAKGARNSRRRFPNCLDLFCLTNVEYEMRKRGDLHFLHSCKLLHAFSGLRSDFSSLSLASYMIELTEVLFPLGVADRKIFDLLKSSFLFLHEKKETETLRILFEVRAMALGGYGINFDRCGNCGRPYKGEGRAVFIPSKGGIVCLKCKEESRLSPGLSPDTTQAFKIIQSAPWGRVKAMSLPDEMVDEIKPVLQLHIDFRVGKRLKSAQYLE